jgi:hypothetical protein
MLHLRIKRPGEQLGQAASRERDFDAIGSDFHAAKQCHERRFDFVRGVGSEFLRDLTATFNQLAPPWTTVRIIVDGIEDRSGVGEKCAKPADHQTLQIAGRYPPAA